MNIYEIVTGKIIECLNQGVVPWERDWLSVPFSNYCTKKAYQGLNQLLLTAQNILNKKYYSCPYWHIWKQVNNLGGFVRKGEKASIIIYYDSKIIEVETESGKGEKEITEKKISFVRYYSVFNQEQTTGIPEIEFNNNEHKKNCKDN
ncbi:MAG: ArdC family protein [Spirochaetes bacterium]|nr:ArdC family protein [Spirochaetota bacterium]